MTSTEVLEVLDGLIDPHCHPGPSPMPREFDAAGGARDGWERLHMRAMVSKCHHHNTQMDVLAQAKLLEDIPTQVFGAVALNTSIGGFNVAQVQMCLGLGGKIVYLPTVSSGRHIDSHAEAIGFPTTTVKVTTSRLEVRGEDGKVVPELLPIFDLVAEYRAVLNGGHLHPEDIDLCFSAAKERGVEHMVISHPDFVIDAEPQKCQKFIDMGAMVEHELHMYDPGAKMKWPLEQLKHWIDTLGAENTLLGSDLGQKGFPKPVDGYIRVAEGLLELGVKPEDLRQIVYHNPRRLFEIED